MQFSTLALIATSLASVNAVYLNGTSTVTEVGTTVITVTSCDQDKCHEQEVTTGLTTVTENETVYVTYCPIPTEQAPPAEDTVVVVPAPSPSDDAPVVVVVPSSEAPVDQHPTTEAPVDQHPTTEAPVVVVPTASWEGPETTTVVVPKTTVAGPSVEEQPTVSAFENAAGVLAAPVLAGLVGVIAQLL